MIFQCGLAILAVLLVVLLYFLTSCTKRIYDKPIGANKKSDTPRLQSSDQDNVYVDVSTQPNAGLGLFASRTFVRGETVCVYSGNVLGGRAAAELAERAYLMRLGKAVSIDAGPCPDIAARYINDHIDRKQINSRFKKEPAQWRALVIATKNIKAGEEIFASYGRRYATSSYLIN